MHRLARPAAALAAILVGLVASTLMMSVAHADPATRTVCLGPTPRSWYPVDPPAGSDVSCFDIETPRTAKPAPPSCADGTCRAYYLEFDASLGGAVANDTTVKQARGVRVALSRGMALLCDPKRSPDPAVCKDRHNKSSGMVKQFTAAAQPLDGAPLSVGRIGYHTPKDGFMVADVAWLKAFGGEITAGVYLCQKALASPADADYYRALALEHFDRAYAHFATA
jgi:hypothetical protein